PAVGPLDRGPEFDALRAPLVQLPAPLAQALRRVRHRAGSDLHSALIHDPDGVRLICPIHSEVIAHSSSSFWTWHSRPRSGNGEVGLIPALSGATFSLPSHPAPRSLADRDSLGVSLRGLCAGGSSGQQAPGRCALPAPLSFPLPPLLQRETILSGAQEDAR